MFRKLLNFRLIQNFERFLPRIEENLINHNQIGKCNFPQFRVCSTNSLGSLYSSTDPKKVKQLKILQLKIAINHEQGLEVPDPKTLTPEDWEHLLDLASDKSRDNYLVFLYLKNKRKQTAQVKKQLRADAVSKIIEERNKEIQNNKHIVYGLRENTLYLKVITKTIKRWANRRLMREMRHGIKLVFDCSYDEYMTVKEANNTAKQLSFCFSTNRKHRKPFNLHMCNISKNGPTMESLHRFIPTMYNKSFPLNLHEKSFTEIFPKKKLVYLTPHATATLQQFNPNDIYIIGSFVDKASSEPLSLAKAKEAGVRMARLPIEQFLDWGAGKKYLTLNQMCDIMLDLRYTRDWNQALLHVPRRKIY